MWHSLSAFHRGGLSPVEVTVASLTCRLDAHATDGADSYTAETEV